MQDVASAIIESITKFLAQDPTFMGLVKRNADDLSRFDYPLVIETPFGEVLLAIEVVGNGVVLVPQNGMEEWIIPLDDIFGRPN